MNIIPRSAWGAIHDDGFGTAPLPAREVWLHHSVTIAPDLMQPFDDDYAAVRTLERIGEQRFGRGISYTFAVTPSGLVFEGHGIGRQGAHTKGRNSIARAICLVGNYDIAHPTDQMVGSVSELLDYGFARNWWVSPRLNGGHCDAPGAQTACPGRHAYGLIPEINRLALTGGSGGVTTPLPPVPSQPFLEQGMMNNPLVRRVQSWGNIWFPSYVSTPLVVDGDFGPATERFVIEFQGRCRIVKDGVIGPITWSKMRENGFR